MKSTFKYILASLLVAATLSGCREDENPVSDGEGILHLSANVNSNVQIISRAELSSEEEEALAESAIIWISNSQGLIHEYIGASQVPTALRLLAGHYTAEAWVGDSVPASWDKTFYKSGFQGFDIQAGNSTEVALTCKVANTLASVSYSEGVLEALSSPVMTVGLEDGITDGSHSLVFDETNQDAKGRFMINSRTKGLAWTLTGEQADGVTYTKSGLIENIKPATEYILRVNFTAQDPTVGGAYFEVVVEEEPVGEETKVEVVLPPTIVGMGEFYNSNTFRAEEGKVGRKSIFISAGVALEEVIVTASDIAPIIGSENIELLHAHNSFQTQLHDKGFNWVYYQEEPEDQEYPSSLRINLEEEFADALTEGDHVYEITAIDVKGKTSTATFTISVTNAPVATSPVNESSISYTSATLEGTVLKTASEYGFMLREVSASRSYEDWTRVPATVSGTRIYAQVNDLKAGATYEYKVYADEFESSETTTFATRAYPQLPNAGFEDWNTSATPYLIYSGSADNMFWDSGNHGSATLKKNVTVPDASIKHSGNYSIKLASEYIVAKFAAGNVFIGKYLATDGTDGVLGWGRPWETRPKAVKLWVKYSPVAVTQDSPSYDKLKKGDMDNGIIYVALLSDATVEATDSKGKSYGNWPVVVKTKSSQRTLFDKNGSNVIGYGEIVFTEATAGNDMIQITIPIDYKSDAPVKNIMMVGSASIGGDYFVGGNGSTMWLDDIELVYE